MLMYSHSLTVWASCSANREMVVLNRIALGIRPAKVFTLLCCLQRELGSNSKVQIHSYWLEAIDASHLASKSFFFYPKVHHISAAHLII